MKRNDKIEKMTDQEWADAAAWLSGEQTTNDEAARILMSVDGEIMKKWNDLKNADAENIDIDKAWNRLNSRIEAENINIPVRRLSLTRAFMRIAAMVVIVLGLGLLIFEVALPEKITVASASDQKNIEVLLADGSKVYLNRDSRLTYAEKFGPGSRKVSLKGEAFFEIAPDKSHPFIIDAGKARVRVVGTSFSVITDNGNNEVEVYVATGTVILTSNDGSRNLTLEPGYLGKMSGTASSRSVNTNVNYLSWNTDRLIYDGEKLGVVFADLKRAYNINIIAADPAINDYRLTTQFDNQPQDTIIKVICTTFNLHSVKEGETYSLAPAQNH
jgi:transmembrane sensor